VPSDVAQHAAELRAAEISGGVGCPASGGRGGEGAEFAGFFDPASVEQRQIFVVHDAPTFGGYERAGVVAADQRVVCNQVDQPAIPVLGVFAILTSGLFSEVVEAHCIVEFVAVNDLGIKGLTMGLSHPGMRFEKIEEAEIALCGLRGLRG